MVSLNHVVSVFKEDQERVPQGIMNLSTLDKMIMMIMRVVTRVLNKYQF